jgi:hypothetical protein
LEGTCRGLIEALTRHLKCRAIPVRGRGGPWGCETSRLPHFLDSRLTLTRRSRHLPGGTKEKHWEPQSGQHVTWPRFEPSISRKQFRSVSSVSQVTWIEVSTRRRDVCAEVMVHNLGSYPCTCKLHGVSSSHDCGGVRTGRDGGG